MTQRRLLLVLVFLLLPTILAVPVRAQDVVKPIIATPVAGDALQGNVTVTGSDNLPGMQSAELAFAYKGDPTGTWFVIAVLNSPVENGTLANWDTTSISDGNYVLRLRVYLNDGTFQEITQIDLRVRNYTAVETPTPAPTSVKPTLVPTVTLTPTPFPTPTVLPTNAAVLTPQDVSVGLGYGGIGALVLLLVFAAYLWIRRR